MSLWNVGCFMYSRYYPIALCCTTEMMTVFAHIDYILGIPFHSLSWEAFPARTKSQDLPTRKKSLHLVPSFNKVSPSPLYSSHGFACIYYPKS